MILADISSGNTGFADVMFLLAMILFLGAASVAWASSLGHCGPRALPRLGCGGTGLAGALTPTAYIVLGAVLAAVIILLLIVL